MATAHAAANYLGQPLYKYLGGFNATGLPVPMMNIINGGEHADNNVDIQEFMIMPVGAKTFKKALQMGTEVFHELKKVLQEKGLQTSVGDEVGLAPNLDSKKKALEKLIKVIEGEVFTAGEDIQLSMTFASSELYNAETKTYELKGEGKSFSASELVDWYVQLCDKYPIVSIE